MLINATQPEELRVALVDGQRLYDLDIESASREKKKSNIYKGTITRIEPSLEAAFVEYGAERHGFLPLKEVSRTLFKASAGSGRVNIKDALSEGQEVVVQVEKEERGTKGAALTTFIGLAGRYLVLMPNNPRAGGVSRRIEGDDRNTIREALSTLEIPEGMGLIVRTAGVERSAEELQWDLDYLLHLWNAIDSAAQTRSAPFLIYQDTDIVIRAIRDYLRNDINEILIDDQDVFRKASNFMQQVMPHNLDKIKLYEDRVPLFNRFQIENQIESAFQREVTLPSGGAIVIDHTEALYSIDINSARATKGGDIEETALNTNLEAADEIARQLRLRDMGGLIVIDYIDMVPMRNQKAVENRLRDAVKADRARVQLGRISRFGLLEMSRQRLRPSLGESSHIVCPRCDGTGSIRDVESLALSILRLIDEDAMKENTGRIIAQLPVDVATFLLNEKRPIIADIEERQDVEILLVPNASLETPHYEVNRIRISEMAGESRQSSHEYITEDKPPELPHRERAVPAPEKPAVKGITPSVAPPRAEVEVQPGLIKRLISGVFGGSEKKAAPEEDQKKKQSQQAGKGQARGRPAGSRTRGGRDQGQGKVRGQGGKRRSEGGRGTEGTPGQKRTRASGRNGNDEQRKQADKTVEQADAQATGVPPQGQADAPEGGERKRPRRGRRGGRNRRRRPDGAGPNAAGGQAGTEGQPDRAPAAGNDAQAGAASAPQAAGETPAPQQQPSTNPAELKPAAATARSRTEREDTTERNPGTADRPDSGQAPAAPHSPVGSADRADKVAPQAPSPAPAQASGNLASAPPAPTAPASPQDGPGTPGGNGMSATPPDRAEKAKVPEDT